MSLLSRTAALAALLAAAAAVVGGCGGTELDPTKIEEQSKQNLEQNLPQRLAQGRSGEELRKELGISADEEIAAVDCPSGVDVEAGATFDCTVTFGNGKTTTETFRIENEDADVTQLSFGPTSADPSR